MNLNTIKNYCSCLKFPHNNKNYVIVLNNNDCLVASFFLLDDIIHMYYNLCSSFSFDENHVQKYIEKYLSSDDLSLKMVSEDEWISYIKKKIHNELQTSTSENLVFVRKKLEEDGGKFVSIGYTEGLLVGVSYTDEDMYYILLNDDRKIEYVSCVGSYDILDEIPDSFSVLQWLIDNDSQSLVDIINEKFKNEIDVLCTPIYIKR